MTSIMIDPVCWKQTFNGMLHALLSELGMRQIEQTKQFVNGNELLHITWHRRHSRTTVSNTINSQRFSFSTNYWHCKKKQAKCFQKHSNRFYKMLLIRPFCAEQICEPFHAYTAPNSYPCTICWSHGWVHCRRDMAYAEVIHANWKLWSKKFKTYNFN